MATVGGYAAVLKYTIAVGLARAGNDSLVLAHRLRHLGDAYRRLGRAALAEPCYREALSIYRQHQGAKLLDVANALRGFAILEERVGARDESRRLWQEAHDLYVRLDVPAGVAESAARLARLRS